MYMFLFTFSSSELLRLEVVWLLCICLSICFKFQIFGSITTGSISSKFGASIFYEWDLFNRLVGHVLWEEMLTTSLMAFWMLFFRTSQTWKKASSGLGNSSLFDYRASLSPMIVDVEIAKTHKTLSCLLLSLWVIFLRNKSACIIMVLVKFIY